jgi:hypothetical protein
MILWTKLFLEAQGYNVDKNIVYQENKSTILLETNGKKSSGRQTRALNIRYFFITNQVEKGNAQIKHCGTNNMIGDLFTKPLQGKKFHDFSTISLDVNKTHRDARRTARDVTRDKKEHFEEQKILSSDKRRMKENLLTLLVIKIHGKGTKETQDRRRA